jgi:hypothetical protein
MRPIAVVLLAVVACAVALIQFLNFSGFCYPQQRWLSDTELITSAITNNLARHSAEIGSLRSKMYSSIEEFHQQNSNCCVLERWNTGPFGSPIFLRFLGVYEALVDIIYRVNDGGGVDNFYGSMTLVNSCGAVLEVRGEPLARNPKDGK